MARPIHQLKIQIEFFHALESGEKKFELRINNRNFQVQDRVYFREITNNGVETGHEYGPVEIAYVLRGPRYGLIEDYCIFNW